MKNLLLLSFLFISITVFGQQEIASTSLQLDSIFGANKGTFVLYNLNSENYQVYNMEQAKTEYSVHSTSKILWTIIGLEEGIVNDKETFSWDSTKYPRTAYWPKEFSDSHTAESALKYSVNWFFIDMLKRMNPAMIEKYLNKTGYKLGFQQVHYFGLTYNIEKSAFDQLDFLKRFYLNELKLSEKTLNIVKSALKMKETESYKLYAKTGMGPVKSDTGIAWYIGFVERDNNVFFFAANVVNDDELLCKKLVIDFSLRTLRIMNIID